MNKAHTEAIQRGRQAQHQARKARWVAAGRCTNCGKERDSYQATCADCREAYTRSRQRYLAYRQIVLGVTPTAAVKSPVVHQVIRSIPPPVLGSLAHSMAWAPRG